VVDDVVTTGATLQAAAVALRHAGAAEPRLYAVASTPAGSAASARCRPSLPTPNRTPNPTPNPTLVA
jgi:hypothetical protein